MAISQNIEYETEHGDWSKCRLYTVDGDWSECTIQKMVTGQNIDYDTDDGDQ